MDWVFKNSDTAKNFGDQATLLCWIHSHVDGKPSYLTSIDLHFHKILQENFPDIKSLVIDLSGNSFVSYEFYELNSYGRQQLCKCLKKPHTFHGSCSNRDFYQIHNNYEFYDFQSLNVVDLDTNSNGYNVPTQNLDHQTAIPNLDGQVDLEDVIHIYPRNVIEQFCDLAGSEGYEKIECMAYLAGYTEGNTIVGTHLVFPHQYGNHCSVEDLGKTIELFFIFI